MLKRINAIPLSTRKNRILKKTPKHKKTHKKCSKYHNDVATDQFRKLFFFVHSFVAHSKNKIEKRIKPSPQHVKNFKKKQEIQHEVFVHEPMRAKEEILFFTKQNKQMLSFCCLRIRVCATFILIESHILR